RHDRPARVGAPRRGGGRREGAPGDGPRREGLHARAAARRSPEGRSLLCAHAALVLRDAQPAGDRGAQGRLLPLRPAGGYGPRDALRPRPERARRVHGRLREARHVHRQLRARGHRADAGRAAPPGLSAAGRGPRAQRDDAVIASLVVASLAAASPAPDPRTARTRAEVEEAQAQIVTVRRPEGVTVTRGSAFYVDPYGHLVTCAHVLDHMPK